MGNCIRHESSTGHATDGDYWEDFPAAEEGDSFGASNNVKKTTTEVKIKISKKQLEEMLGKVEMKELRVDQVLAQLMNHSHHYHSLHRPWRPALQSIPEIN
ncbi:uncharacterized protein LOC133288449 [Gastrolobium bilobum]|uniref:uncharacterized protein LOC133288449 n=1 Tax=Gastrolobium bilobum TaxID=150636 RepID=UPI002AB31211|nr:uncharacterized protein LOC133288449 [Gastrolobium bilobum]